MKNVNLYIAILILLVGLFLGYKIKKTTLIIPEGKVLVTQAFLDSLKSIANKPPIITHDTLIIHDTIIIKETHHPPPQPNPIDSTNTYNDSLKIKDEIDVSISFKTKGFLKGGINWIYKPIYKEIITTIDRPVPYPVPYDVEKPIYKTGYYISLAASGGTNQFMLGSDLDIITKNNYIYGIQYRKFGKENIYGVKIGIQLNSLFKKH